MNIEIIVNPQFNFPNLKFSEKPSRDMLDIMKANGWRWSRTNNVWFPGNNEAKAKAEEFANFFIQKFLPNPNQDISSKINNELSKAENEKTKGQESKENVFSYKVFQLNDNNENRNKRFTGWDSLKRLDAFFDPKDYDFIYEGSIKSESSDLNSVSEEIYKKLNLNRPSDFTGHSLSVSDILIIENNGKETVMYVDDIGYKSSDEIVELKNSISSFKTMFEDFEYKDRIRKFEIKEHPNKPELLEKLNCTYSSWVEKVDSTKNGISSFLFYEEDGKIKGRVLNPNNRQDVEAEFFLNAIENYDLLKPSTKKLRSERKTFVAASASPLNTLEEAQKQNKVPEYLDKLIDLVDQRIAIIEGKEPENFEKEPEYSLEKETKGIIEKINELAKKGFINENAAKGLNKSPQLIDYIITNNETNTLYVFYTNSLIESFDNVFSRVCVRTNEGKWQSEEVKDFIKAVENSFGAEIKGTSSYSLEEKLQVAKYILQFKNIELEDIEKKGASESEKKDKEKEIKDIKSYIKEIENEFEEISSSPEHKENYLSNQNEEYNNKNQISERELSQKDLEIVSSVIPEEEYLTILDYLRGEEKEYFEKKIISISDTVQALQKMKKENINKDGSHPCALHYFLGNSHWYISEIDEDGYGYGYAILNGDLQFSEFGSVNIFANNGYDDALTKLKIKVPIMINNQSFSRTISPELDLHLEEGTTIEKKLYEYDPEYFAEYEKYAKPVEKIEERKEISEENPIPEKPLNEKTMEEIKGEIFEALKKQPLSPDTEKIITKGFQEIKIKKLLEEPHYETLISEVIKTGNPDILHSTFNVFYINNEKFSRTLLIQDENGNNAFHLAALNGLYDSLCSEIKISFEKYNVKGADEWIQKWGIVPNKKGELPIDLSKKEEKILANLPEVSINNIEESNQNITEEKTYGSQIDSSEKRPSGRSSGSNSDQELEGRGTYSNRGNNSSERQSLQFRGSQDEISMEDSTGISFSDTESSRIELNSIHSTGGLPGIDENNDSKRSSVNSPEYNGEGRNEARQNSSGNGNEQSEHGNGTPVVEIKPLSKKEIKQLREKCNEIIKAFDESGSISEEDKLILAQYEGAGGLHEGGQTANAVLSEFYTPNNVIEKVWKIVDSYAPNGKTVLEPSAGTGRFAENRPNNQFTLYELDPTSAKIARILHPEAKIINEPYQRQFFDEGNRIHIPQQKNKYDIVVGNPPYGTNNDEWKGRGEGNNFDNYQEYFLSKGLDALKDKDSILVMVVPSSILNSSNDKQKKILASKGQLIDAYRLPIKTFPTTEVGTDILVFKTWDSEIEKLRNQNTPATNIQDILDSRKQSMAEQLSDNFYFENHPDKVLGEIFEKTNRYGLLEKLVKAHEGLSIQDELNKIDNFIFPKLQKEKFEEIKDQSNISATDETNKSSLRLYEDKEGIFTTKRKLSTKEFAKFYTGANFTEEDYQIWAATDYQGNVDLSKLSEKEKDYLFSSKDYVETSEGVYTNVMLYATGNIYQKLDELEKHKDSLSETNYNRAKDILTKAIPEIIPMNNIWMDAKSPLAHEFQVTREVTVSEYIAGHKELITNTKEIPLYQDFINWATNCASIDNFDEDLDPINTNRSINNYTSARIKREDIPEEISWKNIVDYIEGIPVPTGIDKDRDTKEVQNKKELIAGAIKDARKDTCYNLFNRYLQEGLPKEDQERFVKFWNKINNATVQPDYQKLPLFIDGMSTFKGNYPFTLYKQQIEGINRLLSKGNGLLAYDVGVGKTAAGIVATVGQLQANRCKKPLIIVPNQVYKKWVNDFRELFPDIKVNDLFNLSEKYIEHCYDHVSHSLVIEPGTVTIITDSALQKLTFSDERCENELSEEFGKLLGLTEDLQSNDDKVVAAAKQRIKLAVGQASRIQVKKDPEGVEHSYQQSYIFFDKCGFDNLCVDEAHRYKNLFTVPRAKPGQKSANEFEGLGSGNPSRRAQKIFGMTTLIQRYNENRNVFLLTATPFTNNPLEVYSMLSYMARKELIDRHIYDIRDFCTEFASTHFENSVLPSGDIKPKNVMKSFKGQKKLKNLVFNYIDQVSAEEAGIKRPECKIHKVNLELSPLQQKIIEIEQKIIGSDSSPYVTLKAMTTMRTATLSPALLNPDDFEQYEGIEIPSPSELVESSPKLKWVCQTVADLYKEKPECGQFIYMPQGVEYFDYMKEYLINQGIPEDAIDYINGKRNNSPESKDKISKKFNDKEDKLKILIGSTSVAEGIDLNGNSICEYNCQLGWNPTERIQVEGRIWRQGNQQGKVHIMYPLMENSIDSLIMQKHDEKTSRINGVLSKADNGKDVIDTDEIDPMQLKFDLITDPNKKIDLIIDSKTVDLRKEIKIIDNRIETIKELEEDRQHTKSLYDLNHAEKEKYKALVKIHREEHKRSPENFQITRNLEDAERAVDTCNTEMSKNKNRLGTIMYKLNNLDIREPDKDVPIKLQQLVVRKAELEAGIEKIVNSKGELLLEEQKKILEKKILAKSVEQNRKEIVEYVLKNSWYLSSAKSNENKENDEIKKPIENVKDFVLPKSMEEDLSKAIKEKDFNNLEHLLNFGDNGHSKGLTGAYPLTGDYLNNEKAVQLLRQQFTKETGIGLYYPESDGYESKLKTFDRLVDFCGNVTPPNAFISVTECLNHAIKGMGNENVINDYVKNRNVKMLEKSLQKDIGQTYTGHGFLGYHKDCNPKGMTIEANINHTRQKLYFTWSEIAKARASQLDKEHPIPRIKREEEVPIIFEKNPENLQQMDLFGFEDLKQEVKKMNISQEPRGLVNILREEAIEKYIGLPPFIKTNDNNYVVRVKASDLQRTEYQPHIEVDITVNKKQLQNSVKGLLYEKSQAIRQKQWDNPDYKEKLIVPKPKLNDVQKTLYSDYGISESEMKDKAKLDYYELLCHGEVPIIKAKAKNRTQEELIEKQKNSELDRKFILDTDFDFGY
ncbi:MAG: YodL domain-containing protein [Treponema sp.]|nr:YodL domain-containing protein [Treponema sp.]